jgi:hypothetical protein
MGVTYDDGSFGVEALESEANDGTAQPIEVLEVIGAEERDFSYTDEEITVGSGGDVVVYEGTDPPEELANPSEYEGFQVDIETADSTATVDLSEIAEVSISPRRVSRKGQQSSRSRSVLRSTTRILVGTTKAIRRLISSGSKSSKKQSRTNKSNSRNSKIRGLAAVEASSPTCRLIRTRRS